MKDMFGRFITDNDIVVYVGRVSSSTWLRVARVTKVSEDNVWVHVLAGNSLRRYPYDTVLHVSENVMVANGIDAMGIVTRTQKG